jgi:acyl-coenzyme A synthetase/AMP-(fatty) acid ligase
MAIERTTEGGVIGKGAPVYDRAGQALGVVEDVVLDRRGAMRGVVLRVGGPVRTFFGGGNWVQLTGDLVARVEEGRVHLTVRKDELARVAG